MTVKRKVNSTRFVGFVSGDSFQFDVPTFDYIVLDVNYSTGHLERLFDLFSSFKKNRRTMTSDKCLPEKTVN